MKSSKVLDVVSWLWLAFGIIASIVVGLAEPRATSIPIAVVVLIESVFQFFLLSALTTCLRRMENAAATQEELREQLLEQMRVNTEMILRVRSSDIAQSTEVNDTRPCPICGQPMKGSICVACGIDASSRT